MGVAGLGWRCDLHSPGHIAYVFTLLCRCVEGVSSTWDSPVEVSPLVSPVSPVPGRPSSSLLTLAPWPSVCGWLPCAWWGVSSLLASHGGHQLYSSSSCDNQETSPYVAECPLGPTSPLGGNHYRRGVCLGFHRNITQPVPCACFLPKVICSCNHPSVAGSTVSWYLKSPEGWEEGLSSQKPCMQNMPVLVTEVSTDK